MENLKQNVIEIFILKYFRKINRIFKNFNVKTKYKYIF